MQGFTTYIFESVDDTSITDMFASLRAAESLHRDGYWKSKGEPHYGLHLMFHHINDPIDEQLDELGNQFVTHFGENILDSNKIESKVKEYILKAHSQPDLVSRSLWIEKIIQKNLKNVYDNIKSSGDLTLGLDELLMGVAKEHEDAMYHLSRTIA